MGGTRRRSAKIVASCRGGVRSNRGAALIEFALVSVVLYLMLAGAIEFGRLMFGANVLQDAARVALARVQANPRLSRDVAEVIGKALAA